MEKLLILGCIISMIYYEFTELSPGGIIVPGYIAIYFMQIDRLIATIVLSLLTLLVLEITSNHMILYGRRRFTVAIIISFILKLILNHLFGLFHLPSFLLAKAIGNVVPALIALDMERQGIIKTILSIGITGIIVYLLGIIFNSRGLL